MSLRLTSLQQQVQKELEGLEREIRQLNEQIGAKEQEAETLRNAVRVLGGRGATAPEAEEPRGRRSGRAGGETKTARETKEKDLIREGILRHLQAAPGLSTNELAERIAAEWGMGELRPVRITQMIRFSSQIVGDAEAGWYYVPPEAPTAQPVE